MRSESEMDNRSSLHKYQATKALMLTKYLTRKRKVLWTRHGEQ